MPEKTSRGVLSRILWGFAYVLTFVAVFLLSAVVGVSSAGGLGGTFNLQGSGDNSEVLERTEQVTLDVPYITKEGVVARRPIILYRPAGATRSALVFVPHYEIEAGSRELGDYLREGWAVASPTDLDTSENGQLTDDDLVFNNAALHELRQRSDIDSERIAVVGGSAGGYTALMLGALQLGTTATVATAPVTNVYFNFDQYLRRLDKVTRAGLNEKQINRLDEYESQSGTVDDALGMMLWARWNDLPFPLLTATFRSFAPIANNLPANSPVQRWEAFSPSALARAITSPLAINHNTADMLVPLDLDRPRFGG